MFHLLLIVTIAIGVGLGASGHQSGTAASADVSLLDGTQDETSLLDGTQNETAYDTAKEDWQPEPQDPTGKFTTATEVKPILTATKTAWVAVREYDGNDLLYFTQLVAWRCGLHEIRYSVNDAKEQVFEVEECYENTAQPNAIKMETHLPYLIFGIGTVKSLKVLLTYDDGSEDTATYQRSDILMP